jgi:hypothetical protein
VPKKEAALSVCVSTLPERGGSLVFKSGATLSLESTMSAPSARAMEEGQEDMSKAMNIFGLLLNLAGVVLLFLFGMPFRIATGGATIAWTTWNIDLLVKKLDDVYTVLGWLGLLAIVLGTLLQVWATMERW